MGNGSGTFGPPVSYDSGAANATSVAIADVNGDGKPDLVVANCGFSATTTCSDGGIVSVLLGNGDGTFQAAQTYSSGGISADSIQAADVNGDGKIDIIVANFFDTVFNSKSGVLGVLLGNGDGTFQKAVGYSSGQVGAFSVAVADLNGDSKLDLVVANGACTNTSDAQCAGVLLGNGDGTFQPVVTYRSGGGEVTSIAVADVNGDGKPDLLVTNWCVFCANTVGVLFGNGDGTFQPAVTYPSGGYLAWSVVVADVNGDGKPDLAVANQCTLNLTSCTDAKGAIGVLLNNGDGTFQPATTYPSGGDFASFLAASDINGDGKPDLIVVNYGQLPNSSSSLGVLLNKSGTSTATSTHLSSSPNPSVVGQGITFKTKVTSSAGTPANGETITFHNGESILGTGTLFAGVASFKTSALAPGVYNITASYPGDSIFTPSTSPTMKQMVVLANRSVTSTSLTSSLTPSLYGQSVTFTARVTTSGAAPPTGTVLFTWKYFTQTYTIGSATLNSAGVATLTKSNLNADAYSISAVYRGDTNNLSSTSAVLNQTVLQTTSAAALASSVNPSQVGQGVTFTARISSPTVLVSGPVTFKAGTTVLGTAQLSRGKAILTTSTLPAGSTVVKVIYSGNSNIKASSASVTQTVR